MSPFGVIFAGLFGLLYAPIVMTGLHHMTNAIDSQLINAYDGTILWPMIALSNIAQGSSVLAMSLLQKKNERAQQVNVPACISCYLGVTEPALFGVNLKYGFPLVCGMIGAAAAAMISVGFGVQALSIGVGGLPGILSIESDFYLQFLLAMAVAVAVPFFLTLAVGSRKLSYEEKHGKQKESLPQEEADGAAEEKSGDEQAEQQPVQEENGSAPAEGGELKAFLSGKVIPLEEVPDDVFSKRIIGDGLAIEPTDHTVVAPAAGTVSVVMQDSKHACGITLDNGMEILIHIGIDTVAMNGDGFELFVNQGDHVEAGQPLISFDPEKIRAAGYPLTTILIMTNPGQAKDLKYRDQEGLEAQAGTTAIITFD